MNNLSKTFRYVNALGAEVVFDYGHGYLINKPDGIDTLSVSLSTAQGIDQVGATVQAQSVQVRPITIEGIICGGNQSEKKENLMSVVRPDVPGTLYADNYSIDVYVTGTPTVGPDPKFSRFQIQFTAPYPYWEDTGGASYNLAGVEKKFRFPWNISKPYQFGSRIQTVYAIINNTGQVDCPFTVVFNALASVSDPKIENMITGEFLEIEKNLVAGERVVVETTHSRTHVTSTVDGDCRGALTLESNLFRLHTGDNIILPSAGSGLDDLNVSISFAPERVGIVL